MFAKFACLLAIVGLSGVLASDDVVWMELMSSQIIDADAGYNAAADKNIPALATDLGLKYLVDFLKKADLVDALSGTGPFTVFGPTDRAFRVLPRRFVAYLLRNTTVLAEILKFHAAEGKVMSGDLKDNMMVPSVQGKDIRINIYKNGTVITASGRVVTLADQEASNGVIHEVSRVLFPPPGTVTTVVSKCPIFKTLLTAVKAADLATTLDGPGPFTVFAPSDRAFARIPSKCMDILLKNKTLLTSVLKYHVVPSVAYSAGLSCGDEVKTLQGASVKITKIFGQLRVDYARVFFPDGSTTNGVIHVIDRVLWPRDVEDQCIDFADDYVDVHDDEKDDDELDFTGFF